MADLRKADLSYTVLTKANLHKAWLDGANLSNSTLKAANLSNSYLYDVNLNDANLFKAVLENAEMQGANLNNAKIISANLKRVNLLGSTLVEVQIKDSNLSESDLSQSNLSLAKLHYVDFTNASIQQSNLTGADFSESILTNALFHRSDFTHVVYFPKYGTHPDIVGIATSNNFRKIQFYDSRIDAPALIELREAYRKAGMRSMERLMINMLKTEQRKSNWKSNNIWDNINAIVSYIFFELPSGYGLYPTLPLSIIVILYLVFAVVYWVGLYFNIKKPSLEIWWSPKYSTIYRFKRISSIYIRLSHGKLRRYTTSNPYPHMTLQHKQDLRSHFQKQLLLLRIVLYLSLISAFKIGWRDFKISEWIALLQSHGYEYVMRGWLRRVSGLQALLSFYLLVLWLLTQFGRPFS